VPRVRRLAVRGRGGRPGIGTKPFSSLQISASLLGVASDPEGERQRESAQIIPFPKAAQTPAHKPKPRPQWRRIPFGTACLAAVLTFLWVEPPFPKRVQASAALGGPIYFTAAVKPVIISELDNRLCRSHRASVYAPRSGLPICAYMNQSRFAPR
jgi:hypothetical protein